MNKAEVEKIAEDLWTKLHIKQEQNAARIREINPERPDFPDMLYVSRCWEGGRYRWFASEKIRGCELQLYVKAGKPQKWDDSLTLRD